MVIFHVNYLYRKLFDNIHFKGVPLKSPIHQLTPTSHLSNHQDNTKKRSTSRIVVLSSLEKDAQIANEEIPVGKNPTEFSSNGINMFNNSKPLVFTFYVSAGNAAEKNLYKRKVLEVLIETLNVVKDLRDPHVTKERVIRENLDHFKNVVKSQLTLPLSLPEEVSVLNTALIDLELSISLVNVSFLF